MKKLSRNNTLERNKSEKNLIQRFGLRKMTTGALASVVLGALFMIGGGYAKR